MSPSDLDRMAARFRAMADAALAAVVHDDRALYEPAALRLADAEAERRGGVARPSEEPAPPPLVCVPCGEVREPDVVRVHLPAETPGGVAAFDARTCPVCGWTALFAAAP